MIHSTESANTVDLPNHHLSMQPHNDVERTRFTAAVERKRLRMKNR
jgi:hypothetical protein